MSTRLWTAIMACWTDTKIQEGTFSYDPETAKHDFETESPGWKVIALVPGSHSSGSTAFGRDTRMSEQQSVDVWSMGEFCGPQPTAGGKTKLPGWNPDK